MRHQTENRTGLVKDTGDRPRRAVDVLFGDFAVRSAVPKGDEPLTLESVERLGVGRVVAVMMGNRNPDRLARFVAAGEDRLAVFDTQMHVPADKPQRSVR